MNFINATWNSIFIMFEISMKITTQWLKSGNTLSGDAGCDPIECNLFGKQCQGTFVGQASADSQLQCAVSCWNSEAEHEKDKLLFFIQLQCICDGERDCNYYTFDVEFSLCYLFATCDSYQDCPSCVTGDEQCWQTLGGDCSLAPTPAPTLSPTTVTTTSTTGIITCGRAGLEGRFHYIR